MSMHRTSILLLAFGLSATAQQPAPPAVPVQGVRGQAANGAQAQLENQLIQSPISEPKLSGERLAKLYRQYTGRRVIVTSAAIAAEFAFVQDASPEDPLTYGQAAELLRKAAVLEGFVFTQHPDDPNLDILTLANAGVRPTNVQVDVYNETSQLPDKDIVITYVMTLSYIKPDQAVQIFTQIIGQLGAYGSISSVPNASAVVITEKASLIKSLIELKRTIDVPGSVQATRFIQVQYADVTEMATTLNELLTAQQSVQTTAGVQRAPVDGAPATATPAGVGGSGAGESTPVQIVPDARTNRIFCMGRPVDLVFVENLVREFDIPSSEKTFLRRKLRFLTVSDFLPVAGDALTRAFSGSGDAAAAGGAPTGQSRARPVASNNSSRTTGSSRNSTGSNSFGNSGFGGGNGGGSGGGYSLEDPQTSAAPESLLIGRTLLVADNITNSVVVQGPPSALEIVERLLDQLDVKPQQVMISTVIGQMSADNSKEFGMNYLVDGKDVRGGGGGDGFSVIGPPDVPVGTFPAFNPGSLAAPGLRVFGRIGDLNGYLRALSAKTDFTVLSRPSIFTSNNQKGVISSGEKIAIPTEGGTSSGSYSTGTRIQYQDVVLKLEVIPLVNSDNEITMQIALLNDEQNGTQIIEGAGTSGGDLTVPRIATREILTTATVPNNETIVLGGLIVGKNTKEKSGIPILSDIPVVGNLFGSNKKGDQRSELMVFIQPSVISNDRMLDEVQQDMGNRYDVSGQMDEFMKGKGPLFGGEPDPVNEEPKKKRKIGPIHGR